MTNNESDPEYLDYDRVVVLPAGLSNQAALLRELAYRLEFPAHFGLNLDALSDCLRDLSWLPAGNLHLIHEDLPMADDWEAAEAYVDVLLDAQESWRGEGSRRFTPVFPRRLQRRIANMKRID